MISRGLVKGCSLPLAFLPDGAVGTVLKVVGGGGDVRRLEEMGFVPRARVKVLRSCPSGSMLVIVKDSRVALGRGMAMKILVNSIEVP